MNPAVCRVAKIVLATTCFVISVKASQGQTLALPISTPVNAALFTNDSLSFRVGVSKGGVYQIESAGYTQVDLQVEDSLGRRVSPEMSETVDLVNQRLTVQLHRGNYIVRVSARLPGARGEFSLAISPDSSKTSSSDRTPQDFAIIIGVNDYSFVSPKLRFAANDAREVARVLKNEYGFQLVDDSSVDGTALIDPTKRDILTAISRLVELGPQPEDQVLFFFAGHGEFAGRSQRGFLAPRDALAHENKRWIPVDQIVSALGALNCRHKAIVLDSCYSGRLFTQTPSVTNQPSLERRAGASFRAPPTLNRTEEELAEAASANVDYYRSRSAFVGMSAGRSTPVSDGTEENQHSLFTLELLRVLSEQGNSADRHHEFTFRTLAAQVEARVAYAIGSIQIPNWGRIEEGGPSQDGDFLFRPLSLRLTPREKSAISASVAELRRRGVRVDSEISDKSFRVNLTRLPGDWRGFEDVTVAMRTLGAGIQSLNCDFAEELRSLADLPELPALKSLKLTGTRVHEIGILGTLPNLEAIGVRNTRISSKALNAIQSNKIESLDLRKSAVDDAVGPFVNRQRETLRELDLAETSISDAIVESFDGFPRLRDLNLSQTALTNRGVFNLLQKSPGLTRLTLPERVDDDICPRLSQLACLKRINTLYLSGTALSDDGTNKWLANCPQIETAHLPKGFAGSGVPELAPLVNLRNMGIDQTKLTVAAAKALFKKCPNLESVTLPKSLRTRDFEDFPGIVFDEWSE